MMLIDKHLTRSFLVPLAYCLAGFYTIFIAIDLFGNLAKFIKDQASFFGILQYYCFLLPVNLIIIAPVALVLAVLQSLSSLTKNNELTAMRASGLSMVRLMRPYMIGGLIMSILVLLINETLTPGAMTWTRKFTRGQEEKKQDQIQNITYINPEAHRQWHIREFDSNEMVMRDVLVTQTLHDGKGEFELSAKEGRWLDEYLVFKDAKITRYYPNAERIDVQSHAHLEMMEFNEKPSDFLIEYMEPQFMSSWQLIRYLNTRKKQQEETRIEHEVMLHSRLALPWTCFVATMMGIPFGNHTGRKGAFLGFALSLCLFLAYFVLMQFGLWGGRTGLLNPMLAGWLPVIVSVPVAVYMLYRIR